MFNRCKKSLMAVSLLFSMNGFSTHEDLNKAVTEFKLAFDDLNFFMTKKLIKLDFSNFPPEVCPENWYANQSVLNYHQKMEILGEELLLNLHGNSFIMGVSLACLSWFAGFDRKKMGLGLLPGVAGLLVLQRQQVGNLPYYNILFSAEPGSNWLAFKPVLFSQTIGALLPAIIGYIGVNYIFDRWDGFKKITQEAGQAELEEQE